MGMFLLTVGVAVWKLTAKGNTDPGYLILEYILLGCGHRKLLPLVQGRE